MSLERVQARNNLLSTGSQATKTILAGGELAAAGRSLGLSEEETLAAVSRQFRRQKRQDDSVTEADVLRQMAQAGASTVESVGTPELQGTGYKGEDDVAFAFGEDIDYNTASRSTRADDEQTYRAADRGFTEDPETGLVIRETFEETKGDEVNIAPKSVLMNALNDLQGAANKQKGSAEGRLSQAMGISAVDPETDRVMTSIQEQLGNERQLDSRLGAALVRKDNERYRGRRQAYNNIKATIEADQISRDRYVGGGQGQFADEAIGRMAEIRSLGKVGETAQVIQTANDAIQGQVARRHDGVYLDPRTGNPVAVQGPEFPSAALAGDRRPNSASTANALNAPQSARDWVSMTMPDYRESGRTFGDYPQVDITLETTQFANKLREYGKRSGIPALANLAQGNNIRTVDELEKVAGIVSQSMPEGRTLMIRSPQTGRSVPAGNQVISGLMQELRMTSGDEQRLANAMYQMDAAKRSSVNQNPTGTYLGRSGRGPGTEKGVMFNSAEAMGDYAGTPIAQQKKGSNIQVGTSEDGKAVKKDIVAALRELGNQDAARPYIGMPANAPTRKDMEQSPDAMKATFMQDQVYNRSGETQPNKIAEAITNQARKRAKGKPIDSERNRQNIINAIAVQRRADEANTKRADQMSTIISSLPPTARRSRLGRA